MRGPGAAATAPAGHAEPVIRALRVAAARLDDAPAMYGSRPAGAGPVD